MKASQSLDQFDLISPEEVQHPVLPDAEQETECYKAFQKFYSKEISMDMDQEYFILNRDTGELLDSRILEQQSPPRFDAEQAWKNYWQQSTLLSEKLISSVQKGDIQDVQNIMQILKNSYYIDINTKDLDDWTPLHFACNQNDNQMTSLLLENGAQPNAVTTQKRNALHFAALRNNPNIAHQLISYGADINAQDNEGNTPLHIASQFGQPQVCQLLFQNKANPLLKNQMGMTPIECATNGNIVDIFAIFGIRLEQFEYSRTLLPDTNIMLMNSRQDHIQKLMGLNRPESVQHRKSQEIQMENIVEDIDDRQSELPRRSTWSKLVNYALRFTQIVIHRKDPVVEDPDKLGPNSFIYYQLLGEGGFGKVYMVEKKGSTIKKYYAMKVMKKEDMDSSNIIKSAQIEKDVLSIMDHPFIVKLNCAFQTNTHLYMVMDLCPGGDLSTQLELKCRLPEEVVKIYAAEITLALEALHQNGIIFRDLKPENVVIDNDGHAMLTDFGLSKQGADEEALNNSFCGTLAYLAPEVLMRKGHGRQVDWYMLGVFIYELLVGVPPYYDSEKEIVKENIRKGSYKLHKFLSEDVKDLIVQLLNRNPKKRLGNVGDSKDIKSHAWFKNIDWDCCFQRKLIPPKPNIFIEVKEPMQISLGGVNTKNKVQGWTFIEE